MSKNKTIYTGEDVYTFVEAFADTAQKRADSLRLIEWMKKWTGEEPKMWGPSIIGFGNYHYKYASGHEGDAPVISFSPRKAALTLYVYSDTETSRNLITRLGKFTQSKACIYVKKLSDIDANILENLCKESIRYISEHHECYCRARD